MGRKICGTATSFGPACYNVNMYHAENMLQTNASKHAYRSKSYIAYLPKFAFHSSHSEKQMNALYNQSTLLFESLPETRCSVNAIHTNACTEHLIPQMETGSDEAQRSPNIKCKELQSRAQHGRSGNLKRKAGIRRLRLNLRVSKPKITQCESSTSS